jgi:hypothetical protein
VRILVALAMIALLGLAGCGAQQPLAPWPPLRPLDPRQPGGWPAIADSMPAHLQPASANVCGRGVPACMNAIVAEMTRRLDTLAEHCDHRAPFLLMYRQVSEEVALSVKARRYQEPGYVAHLDAVFATLYFHAAEAWNRGRVAEVPHVWQIAFSAAAQHRVTTLGDMLLGMNAHISRDLPYAIAAVGLKHSNGTDGTSDVVAVNADIARAQGPMLTAIAARFDPAVGALQHVPAWAHPDQVGKVIAAWRLEAIENARRLLAAHSHAALERVEQAIDDNATIRSLVILAATSYPHPASETLSRDRYCESHAGAAGVP